MRKTIVILAGLAAIAFASKRDSRARFRHLNGWQKVLGIVAVFLALLVILNPDFIVLGLLGDTTFFDVLVMALSVQLLVYFQWGWRSLGTAFTKSVRWMNIPSPGLRYELAVLAVAVGSIVSSVQKVIHRILS